MAKEIDLKKLFESLARQSYDYYYGLFLEIKAALEEQGFKYDFNKKEIVSIEPENTIKAGNWYVCDCEIINKKGTAAFHRDSVYYCPKDGWLDVDGMLIEVGILNQDFRPATESEIEDAKKKWYVRTENWYRRATEEEIPQEPKQDTSELSEFERAVSQTISGYMFLPQDINHCVFKDIAFGYYKKCSKELFSIAEKEIRKNIANKIQRNEDWLTSKFLDSHRNENMSRIDAFRYGIEYTLRKIKKGVL